MLTILRQNPANNNSASRRVLSINSADKRIDPGQMDRPSDKNVKKMLGLPTGKSSPRQEEMFSSRFDKNIVFMSD
uniref:Uncharacterized protein n=1 Tax=Megaselia scalaris TaxID=36166 RepID=T1GPE7_MEGSC